MNEILKKLKIEKASKLLILNAPESFHKTLSDFNYDVEYKAANSETYDFIQVFATSQVELERLVKLVEKAGKYDCLFWICYPKGGGKIKSDIKRDTTWAAFALINLRPVFQIAIDETWSALRGRPHDAVGK